MKDGKRARMNFEKGSRHHREQIQRIKYETICPFKHSSSIEGAIAGTRQVRADRIKKHCVAGAAAEDKRSIHVRSGRSRMLPATLS